MPTQNGSNPFALVPAAAVPVSGAWDGAPATIPPAAAAIVARRLATALRTAVVALRLAPLVASFVRDHRRWLVVGAPVPRTTAFHDRRAARLVRTLGTLGPAWVKLAQLLAARADLVPEPYLGALGALADQVPPVSAAAVRQVIVEAYGEPPETLFETFDPTPLAAASLGQVHRARWRGEDVVVKVLRPGVEALVAADVRAADRLFALAERWAPNPHLRGVRNAVREFGVRVWEEMDFRREAANAAAIHANFVGRPGVAVPRVAHALTRRRVMVMEFMRGTRIDRLQDRVAAGTLDAPELVRRVIELYMRMMLVDGFFHADPHPGNLLVADPAPGTRGVGTIIVLDFGMVVPVERAQRRLLTQTAFAGIQQDVDGLVAGFFDLGLVDATADRATMRELVETLLEVAHTPETTSLDRMSLLADRVMSTLYRYPVTLPSDLVYFARTAALIEGLGARYDTQFNGTLFAAPVALRLRREIAESLREPGERDLAFLGGGDWGLAGGALGATLGTAVGRALGDLAGLVTQASQEVAGLFDRLFGAAPGTTPGTTPGTALDRRRDDRDDVD